MDNKRKIITLGLIGLVTFIASLLIYSFVSADAYANKVAINNIKMTGISTGVGTFSNDGLNYNDQSSYQKETGYTAGNDSNDKNRLVRSFDKITYHFNFTISDKNSDTDYEERKVDIKVTLPDEIKNYVTFDENSFAGESTHTFTFDGIDTYGVFNKDITLYILGAPNGTKINPKFEIQESTNTDSNYVVTLGNFNETYNYEYDKETNRYSTTSSVSGFTNYMPTIVSSKASNVKFKLLSQTGEGQKAIYDNKVGRYLTYILGIEIEGDNDTGIKGYTMPNKEDISFNITSTQDGYIQTTTVNNEWIRLYGTDSVSGIEPVTVKLPYSTGNSESSKKTKSPGNVTANSNNVTVSGYNFTFTPVKVNADGSNISNSDYVIGTYAITVFSQRNTQDSKNDITNNITINNINVKDTAGTTLNVSPVSSSLVNKYYENQDYSLTGKFYDESGKKLSSDNIDDGSTSKGTDLIYKTTFNYKQTLSTQGLKETIKVDPNAFRVVPYGIDDIKITVESSDDSKLSAKDFEIKYITGNFDNKNYSFNNSYDKIQSEDLTQVQNLCSSVSNNLSTYTSDQIMNLYSGPCIKANENTEVVFNKIDDAKTEDNKEIPITKIIIQTKEGVVLPDSTKVIVEVKLRVRNVKDLTHNYQVVSSASSSDYDENLVYYSPRITNDEKSITNPNNYKKTVYRGSEIESHDSNSPWADSLKIVHFTSRQTITLKNKNSDGSVKTNFNVNKGETLYYNIQTIISDQNMQVGADDVWYINKLKVVVFVPNTLQYIPDKELGNPTVEDGQNGIYLIYELPYTKPNMTIPEINFKAKINPKLKGTGIQIVVQSKAEAININNETDTSYFSKINSRFEIYATGIENVVVTQKVGEQGGVVEKNSEFSYLLSVYNNTDSNIDDYGILDILPSNKDSNSSIFSGNYKVKLEIPSTLGSAKVLCSKDNYSKLIKEVFNTNNTYEECDVTNNYVDATAIKITNISVNANSSTDDIKVTLKPSNNKYSDKYINKFIGASETYSQTESNEISVRVVSRNISGRVFVDTDEDGTETKSDKYLKDIPVTLYKLDTENNLTKVSDTVTDSNGNYKFKDLDVGRYKVRATYDKSKYDLTLRYATADKAIDSDAYKIQDGLVEISNKRTPDQSDGIRVTRDAESIENMDIGLISRKTFGFDVDKYITKVDLTYNNMTTTTNYKNQKVVKQDVRNTWNASSKVYYGIKISNNSNTAGYVKLINESIPLGSTFDENDKVNDGWFYSNGELQNISLENDLIMPGETRYLTVALNIPPQAEARTYVNTVTLLDIEQYEREKIDDADTESYNRYHLGEALSFAGENWHIVNVANNDSEQILTLLADSSNTTNYLGHTTNSSDTYKWSASKINKYINGDYLKTTSLDTSALITNSICDDASGLPVQSYGGTLLSENTCQSGIYNDYKVRLLTEKEFNSLKNSDLEDLSWLYGNNDFWLQNSVYVTQEHDIIYGKISDVTIVKNLAKYVNKQNASVQTGYNSDMSNWVRSNTLKEVRPVITISSNNIIGLATLNSD